MPKSTMPSLYKITEARLPDGEYLGIWSGNEVTLIYGGLEHQGTAATAIRGTSKCVVTVRSGEISVQTT